MSHASAEGAPFDADPNDPSQISEVEQLRHQLQSAKEDQIRLLAEMDNQRKRAAREAEQARKFAGERLLNDLLPVLDSLEAGLAQAHADPAKLRTGVELTLKMLQKAVEANGLSVVDPMGAPFSAEHHQAMAMVPTSQHEAGTVVSVMQKGYCLNGRLLRPAMVGVAEALPPPEDA